MITTIGVGGLKRQAGWKREVPVSSCAHLCERLMTQGLEVLGVGIFFTGTKHNLVIRHAKPSFEILQDVILFPLQAELDPIYNRVYPARPIHDQNDPLQTTKVNVYGTINMLGLA